MEEVYRNFYRSFYLRTNGYMPAKPLSQQVYPGDFFQIRNGHMILLGNIFRNGVIGKEDARLEYGIKLNPSAWQFSDGISKPHSDRGSGQGPVNGEPELSRQVLAFNKRGSFFFKGNAPEAVKITNWNELQQQLIIKLTQTHFSFRELYLVTESVTLSDWALAISGSDKGKLEIAADSESSGLTDVFGHQAAKTIQSKDIEFYHREDKRKPVFFKAKKLVVQNDKLDLFMSELVQRQKNQDAWASEFYDFSFHYDNSREQQVSQNVHGSLLDMLQANELNPNTALMYFKWADLSLDDVEKLFSAYGD